MVFKKICMSLLMMLVANVTEAEQSLDNWASGKLPGDSYTRKAHIPDDILRGPTSFTYKKETDG